MRSPTPLNFEERRLAKLFYVSAGIFIGLGYVLYLVALLLPHPIWILNIIDALKPFIGALATADLVSDKPLPAQVVTTYSVVGFVALSTWFGYANLWQDEARAVVRRGLMRNAENSRVKLAAVGAGFSLMLYLFVWFFARQDSDIGWQEIAMLSPSFGSITMQLLTAATFAATWPQGLYALLLALTPHQKHDIQS